MVCVCTCVHERQHMVYLWHLSHIMTLYYLWYPHLPSPTHHPLFLSPLMSCLSKQLKINKFSFNTLIYYTFTTTIVKAKYVDHNRHSASICAFICWIGQTIKIKELATKASVTSCTHTEVDLYYCCEFVGCGDPKRVIERRGGISRWAQVFFAVPLRLVHTPCMNAACMVSKESALTP